jgi:hypothetical protein
MANSVYFLFGKREREERKRETWELRGTGFP